MLGNLGPLPFRFSSTWNDREVVKNIIVDVLENQIIGSPSYLWESKHKSLRKDLKYWENKKQLEIEERKIQI